MYFVYPYLPLIGALIHMQFVICDASGEFWCQLLTCEALYNTFNFVIVWPLSIYIRLVIIWHNTTIYKLTFADVWNCNSACFVREITDITTNITLMLVWLLNQACIKWILVIDFVHDLCMRVCLSPRLLICSDMIWLNKFNNFYMAAIGGIISRRGLA